MELLLTRIDRGRNKELPFIDFTTPSFSTRSEFIKKAQKNFWCARTSLGLVIFSYKHVGKLLRDRRLRQGSYAWPSRQNAEGSFADFWRRSVISQEGLQHERLRLLSIKALDDDFICSLIPKFKKVADDLCISLRQKNACEFQSEFALPFAGKAICVLLNFPLSRWQEIANDASILGLAMGLNYKLNEKKINDACDRLINVANDMITRAEAGELDRGLVHRLVSLSKKFPEIDKTNLIDLVVMLIFGGVDTTRSQLGFTMALFDRYPEQWNFLSQDPSLVPNAIEEAIRAWPTTTWSTREAKEDFVLDGVRVLKGQTLHLLVHASSKDPALGDLPEFDIRLKQQRHHGFGGGAHHCLGHFMARTDMSCALNSLVKTFLNFKLNGCPRYLPDSGNTSPEYLPLSYTVRALT